MTALHTAAEGSLAGLLTSWLDDEWEARFLIDQSLSILWSNRLAARWLEGGEAPFRIGDGHLCGRDPRVQAQLSALIAAALDGAFEALLLETPGLDLLVRLKPVGQFAGRHSFGLSIRQVGQEDTHMLVGLRQAFKLTGAEEAVLHQMARGSTVERIARDSRVSPETVRTHVRRVYSKMAVSSREEMFSRLKPFMFAR